jgi:hypothetical protein
MFSLSFVLMPAPAQICAERSRREHSQSCAMLREDSRRQQQQIFAPASHVLGILPRERRVDLPGRNGQLGETTIRDRGRYETISDGDSHKEAQRDTKSFLSLFVSPRAFLWRTIPLRG